MAGKAEPDEPLPVELTRLMYQQYNPPPVVFDQIVVGGEDVGDTALFPYIWYKELECEKFRLTQVILSYSLCELLEAVLERRIEEIFYESDIGPSVVRDKSNDTIRETCINSENRRIRNVCGYRNAECTCPPQTTLGKASLAVRLLIGGQV